MEWDHAKRVCEIHIAGIPSQEAHDRFLDEDLLAGNIKPAVAFAEHQRIRLLAESTGTNGEARGFEGTSSPQFSSNILISGLQSVGSNPTLSATYVH
jgi:hypothetical protein